MLNLVLPLTACLAVVLVCAAMASQLRLDRAQRPAPRHRSGRMPPKPAHQPLPTPKPVFDPLDKRTPLADVERFLADLEIDQVWAEAHRENWARTRVAEEGKSWETHLAKFSGAVLPREDADTRELVAIA